MQSTTSTAKGHRKKTNREIYSPIELNSNKEKTLCLALITKEIIRKSIN